MAAVYRSLIVASLLAIPAISVRAQRPSAQQVQQILKDSPGTAEKLRAKIAASGLSPDQIRARLRAAGYPETLLDAYLGSSGSMDSLAAPGNDVMRAVRFLGLVDSTESMRRAQMTVDSGVVQTGLGYPSSTAARKDISTNAQLFGLDVFRRSTSQFEPDVAGPVDASYKVGPRDVLALILTGGVENSYNLEVTREGFVVIPQVGQVYVANLTLDQVTDVLLRRLQRVYSGIGRGAGASTQFYVTVARLRTNQIFVVGDAIAPGSYQVSSAGTMLTALYAAGGPSDNGTLRNVELRRDGKTVSRLDVYGYLTRGDASQDARLETGDVLFVPVHGSHVRISGEVIRPATYEMARGETLRDLVNMAGGFTAQAVRRRVLVRRIVPPTQRAQMGPERTVLDITSDELATGSGPAVPLEDGDIVEVFSVPEKVRNMVVVDGAVWTPGAQGFAPGMHLSEAIRRAGGVKPDVKDVLISRLQSDQTRRQLRASFVDTLGTLGQDLALQEDDSIQVFGTSDFRPDRYVAITGAVNKGGRFAWREGMTLRDLVHLAGGLDDGAYLVQAEVARLPDQRDDGTLARTVTVPLDSSYLLERGLDGRYHGPPGISTQSASAPDVQLLPYDNVLILRQPDWQLERTVTIAGEVKFPGNYTLRSKEERVSDLVERAGGLQPRAYVPGAMFTRSTGAVGRIGVDLDEALKNTRSRENLTLLPGDTLYIPRFQPTVKVEGAVNSPISVAYIPGKNLKYYIDAAGGARYDADLDRAYVRQPNGIVDPHKGRIFFLPDHNPKPDAGAIVTVPAKDPDAKKDWASLATAVAQILASTVAIVAIAMRK
jgi:polysaccharide biosynthesis/export protein